MSAPADASAGDAGTSGVEQIETDEHAMPPHYVDSPGGTQATLESAASTKPQAAESVAISPDKLLTLPDSGTPSRTQDGSSTSISEQAGPRLPSTTLSSEAAQTAQHHRSESDGALGSHERAEYHAAQEYEVHTSQQAGHAADAGATGAHAAYADDGIEVHSGSAAYSDDQGGAYMHTVQGFDGHQGLGQAEASAAAVAAVAAAAAASRYGAYQGLETRITWADQNGKALAEVFYSDNLHYSSDWVGDDMDQGSVCCTVM